jgi:hypothetical protein
MTENGAPQLGTCQRMKIPHVVQIAGQKVDLNMPGHLTACVDWKPMADPAPEVPKLNLCPPGYTIVPKADGVWLQIKTSTNRQAALQLESVAEKQGNMVGAILLEWCQEFRGEVADTAPEVPVPVKESRRQMGQCTNCGEMPDECKCKVPAPPGENMQITIEVDSQERLDVLKRHFGFYDYRELFEASIEMMEKSVLRTKANQAENGPTVPAQQDAEAFWRSYHSIEPLPHELSFAEAYAAARVKEATKLETVIASKDLFKAKYEAAKADLAQLRGALTKIAYAPPNSASSMRSWAMAALSSAPSTPVHSYPVPTVYQTTGNSGGDCPKCGAEMDTIGCSSCSYTKPAPVSPPESPGAPSTPTTGTSEKGGL